MDQDELIKKAQSGEQVKQEDIDSMIKDKKKDAIKQVAIGGIIGLIASFFTQFIGKFFGGNQEK